MLNQMAAEEYAQALRKGQKEYRERISAGLSPYPAVLDEIRQDNPSDVVVDVGLIEIPAERIVGTKSAGRISAFSSSFLPLLDSQTEFSMKWMSLCKAHMGETGITDPIECYEYLGNFYVQEGNKRVSVLRHFEAARIPGNVKRILPPASDEPRIKAYFEFLEFYKKSRLYTVQFRRPGDYAKLLAALGKKPQEMWTEEERRTFNSSYHYFLEAFQARKDSADVLPEEALLLWLELYDFGDLKKLTSAQLKKTLTDLWKDVVSSTSSNSVKVQTKAREETRQSFLDRVLTASRDKLNVAFVHQLKPSESAWVTGHEEGKEYLERVLGDYVTVRSYYDANTMAQAEERIEEAVSDGAQVVFTTAPLLSRATLKAAVKYPKIKFLNCSVEQPYSRLRTYYGRIYEAKFITGAIAGAMDQNDRIGYIAAYPIFGVPASINAFALGAQLTNPRAQIDLRWSCLPGTPQADLLAEGVRVISNREAPTKSRMYLEFCTYGTYLMEDRGELIPLATPVWVWGRFYEFAIRSILSGGWRQEKGSFAAWNYWLGMDSGVIGLSLSDRLPAGVRQLGKVLQRAMTDGSLDPFFRRIVSQDGTVRNDGSRTFTPEQLLRMDWLCDNVAGAIPAFEEIQPISRRMVRELGVYRDRIPPEKEGAK